MDLQNADLREASLQGADMREANLQGAQLQGADLWEANLRGINFRAANLEGIKRVSKDQISKVESLFEATLDSDLKEQLTDCPHLFEEPPE